MYTIKSYHYEGPIQLGSVVAHHCGAAGLFSAKEEAHVVLKGQRIGADGKGQAARFQLTAQVQGQLDKVFEGEDSSLGRRQIGQDLLVWLRHLQGLEPYPAWGTMVGVRTTKFVHNTMNDYEGGEELALNYAMERLEADFHVSSAKRELLAGIARLQRPLVAPSPDQDRHISVYGGIPFCQTRCTYCSFPYGLIQDYDRVPEFLQAFGRDAQHLQELIREKGLSVDSLYIGGGTPTAVDDGSFEGLLDALDGIIVEGREYTLEAGRPDSVTDRKLKAMMAHGVNRISVNPQTMDDRILRLIGRGHTADDIRQLYKAVREQTDFAVNMDFIAGLPGQAMSHMQDNMNYICEAMPENVTIHTLALKKGSPLYDVLGRLEMPYMEAVKDMVAYASERLLSLGYQPYYLYRQQYMTGQLENIGYALPGHMCHYNVHMMEERQSILSIGPGSSSKWMRGPDYRQVKQHMPKNVDAYIDTLDQLLEKRKHMSNTFWEVV